MRHALMLLTFLAVACTPGEDPIAAAEDVVRSHEQFASAGDLEGVLSNAADDIVVLASGLPLVEGKAAFAEFYRDLLAMGQWEFGHDYAGATVLGDAVVLHGVARGNLTPPAGTATQFANNFIMVLRPGADGRFKFWRIAFAPSSQ